MSEDIKKAEQHLERVRDEASAKDPHDPQMKEKVEQARAQLVVLKRLEENKSGGK